MHYKIEGALRRNKKNFIIFIVLWFILTIVLVMPIGYSITQATVDGQFNMAKFFSGIYDGVSHLGTVIGKTFTPEYILCHLYPNWLNSNRTKK